MDMTLICSQPCLPSAGTTASLSYLNPSACRLSLSECFTICAQPWPMRSFPGTSTGTSSYWLRQLLWRRCEPRGAGSCLWPHTGSPAENEEWLSYLFLWFSLPHCCELASTFYRSPDFCPGSRQLSSLGSCNCSLPAPSGPGMKIVLPLS